MIKNLYYLIIRPITVQHNMSISAASPDRLNALLQQFSLSSRLFHAGALCGIVDFDAQDVGYLHVVRRGPLRVTHRHEGDLHITEPTVLFYPQPLGHRFIADAKAGADMVCASVKFSGGKANPLASALPPIVALTLAEVPTLAQSTTLLFDEALEPKCGRQALVDRLFEVVIIQLIRHLMAANVVNIGVLAGLAHPQLRNAIIAMHEQPEQPWTIETLAAKAAMSRSTFAVAFHDIVGTAPGDYLTGWRISLAQIKIKQGKSLKHIAMEVGYGSEVALSRAFSARVGMSARAYKQQQ
jgi:AraC-like DNA-binding protein